MFKASAATISEDPTWSARPGFDRTSARWLVSRDVCQARGGLVGIIDIDAGSVMPRHRTLNADTALCAIDGRAVASRADGPPLDFPRGSVIFVRAGEWHDVRADEIPVSLLVVYGGVTSARELEWEGADDADPSAPTAEQLAVINVPDESSQSFHDPSQGYHHISATWLIDAESHGTNSLVLGQARFLAGKGLHELHRHPHAEEFVFMLQGEGTHLAEDERVPLGVGDLMYIPAGEWHGLQADNATALIMFGYLGIGSLSDAGNERPSEQDA
jgi:quercetin dioxygenase-like cupin family protein